MSGAPAGGDEVRDTLVPTDAAADAPAGAPHDAERDTIVPAEAPPPVLRRDPDRRVRRGLALGGGVALLVVATGVAPLVAVALLAPRAEAPAPPAHVALPVVDFAALRAAVPAPPAPAAPATTVESSPAASLHAFARLSSRVYEAREAWRKAGQAGRELFRTATLDELGGAALVDELKLGPRRVVWLRREARVLAPAGAVVPDAAAAKDAGNDPGPVSFDGTLDARAVRATRTCMFGETYCLVEVVDAAVPVAAAAAPDDEGRLAAFDAAVAREAARLAAWQPPAAAGASAARGLLVPLGAAFALAAVLIVLTTTRLRNIATSVAGATGRLRAAAAGRAEPRRGEPSAAAEIADLELAVDEVGVALGDGAARAEQAARRRARLGDVATALAAAGAGHLEARAPLAGDDDAALAALASTANAAIEQLDARVGRWKGHAAAALDATGADALRALHAELAAVSTSPSLTAGRRGQGGPGAGRRGPEPPQ